MAQIDSTPVPDFAAMSDRDFNDAIFEFLDLCDYSHPHWKLWAAEQRRRGDASRAARIASARHLPPGYVNMTKTAA